MEICSIYNLIKQLPSEWKDFASRESSRPYFEEMATAIEQVSATGSRILPAYQDIFRAFHACMPDDISVVILGQDPYHRVGQAMGLSFSVPKGVRVPPSLRNIYKELSRDLGIPIAQHGDLSAWADQGVFLLNSLLTVEEGSAGSHRKIGWQSFTDSAIKYISDCCDSVVFMLWGNFAKGKHDLIDDEKHLVLQAAHPSPLAGNRYAGCSHFSKANDYLLAHERPAIDWGAHLEETGQQLLFP